ncbi:daunorubicin resistance protein DrrA family ABC transporter ATP-binding protein [Streptomyces albidoflavus]|uniref:daunorubicin resistance protein DrrA family ABC transporter ATP-binding protein n=1 Tax=Streptomyces albidoflavus TaxID=1886 RepID=UPI000249420B|nr:daunorubicin resistance protein DrrA family ABC transporter ATP-binding protein [Streptomyces albidoflavus]RZD80763.1 daunorubicin resistance protein DrrA family ABC transporter ATP-binding protein [Streptomyces albidoflavus]RZD98333.1 daunorubicin resistance protein DrrA family ABC transporter ATP-binding protein [Streptomyces albidoflavus]
MPTSRRGGGDDRPPAAITITGLRKAYGDKTVLDGIDLRIPAGSVFALLGPNGAGKTTTVNILSTLVPADGGRAEVAGHDVAAAPDRVRAAIGVTGQFAALDDLLTAEENLLLMADLLRLGKREGRSRTQELLERFGIADVAGRRAALFSGGMRRRLDLAMTLVGDPRVIFLDEPTTGLDPRSRRTMWETVRELVAGGTTVFLTTQYLEEADQLADRIAVLDGGRIVAEGTADELKARIPGSHVRLRFTAPADYERAATVFPDATRDDEQLALRVAGDGGLDALRALLDRLDGAGAHAAGFSVHTPDLDDVFLALTGEGAKETQR